MKIVLAVQRKIGQPNFGSEGASCEITLDLPETSARDSAMIVAEIRAAYNLAERAVGEQLARHGGPPTQLAAPAPAEAVAAVERTENAAGMPAPARAATPSEPTVPARPATRPSGPNSTGGGGGSGFRGNGQPPRSGKALFAWCKDREAEHDYALLRYLNGWAKLQDFPGRMVDWNNDQVSLAYSEATRKLQSLNRAEESVPQEAVA